MIDDPYKDAAFFFDRYRPRYPAELIDFVLRLTPNLDEYLDLGCGTGALLVELTSHFRRAVGVDVDANMLQKAAARKRPPAATTSS